VRCLLIAAHNTGFKFFDAVFISFTTGAKSNNKKGEVRERMRRGEERASAV
jgi:hypothetical protein